MATTSQLQLLNRLVGTWTTEGTHPAVPGVVVHGTTTMEWFEGARFLVSRSQVDHPQFPDAISLIGHMGQDRVEGGGERKGDTASPDSYDGPLRMHYFDSRGVFRVFEVSIDDEAWRFWRDAPGFSQQFTGTFTDGGNTIVGQSLLRRDDVHWADDLRMIYRRQR
jgi:hypothetical protein